MANKRRRPKTYRASSRSGSDGYNSIEFSDKPAPRRRKKKTKQNRFSSLIAAFCVVVILLAAYFITILLHPVGVIEYVASKYTSIGSGEGYSIDLSGGKPLYTLNGEDKYFVVSTGSVASYNKNGRLIFEKAHSLSEPVLKHSETRYMLYGQGERTLTVNTFSKELYTHTFDSGIIAADISDSGAFAVATKADSYNSSVAVFSKNNKKIYEWFSSDATVSSLALSPDGKTVAVSTVKVDDGKYITGLYILKYNSADAVYKKTYSDEVIYKLIPIDNSKFCAVLDDNIEFIDFKKSQVVSHESEYSVSIVKATEGKLIAVRTIAANQDESIVETYNRKGELVSSFSVNSFITDFSYNHNKIYLLGLHDILKYNSRGELLARADASYDALFIEAVSSNSVACVKNSSIDKCELTAVEVE